MNNKEMDIINDVEFTSLFQKSKKLIDNARSNMGQMANHIRTEKMELSNLRLDN